MPRSQNPFKGSVLFASLASAVTFTVDVARAGTDISNYAVWGKAGAAFGQSAVVKGGLAGSDGSVATKAFDAFYGGLVAGGDLTYTTTGGITVYGPTTLNGNANFGIYDSLNGAVNSGQNITFQGSPTVAGNITAAGSVTIAGAGTIGGNVAAGNDATIGGVFTTVNGNVAANHILNVTGTITGHATYGNSVVVGSSAHVNAGAAPGFVAVSPTAYAPQTLPAADVFTSGGPNVTNGGTAAAPLSPGSYGTLTLPTFGDLYLAPGNYYFSALNFATATALHLVNLTPGGKIHIYSTGDVTGHLFFPDVNGVAFASADPALASNVLLETLGNYSATNSDFYGSIFAPNGSITTSNGTTVDGSLIAAGTVTVGTSAVVNYVTPSDAAYVVPEPAALSLAALAVPMFLGRRRSRRAAW